MNAARRKEIQAVIDQLTKLRGEIETVRDQIDELRNAEQEYFDAMPESMQGGEKGDRAQTAISALDNAYSDIDGIDFDGIESSLNEAME